VSTTSPLYAFTGLALAATTLVGLVWLRLRSPRSDAVDTIQLPPVHADYELLFTLSPHPNS